MNDNNEIEIELDEVWIGGKYENGELNWSLSFVSIPNFFCDGTDFFVQGHEADEIIREIDQIWKHNDLDQAQAIEKYKNMYAS